MVWWVQVGGVHYRGVQKKRDDDGRNETGEVHEILGNLYFCSRCGMRIFSIAENRCESARDAQTSGAVRGGFRTRAEVT